MSLKGHVRWGQLSLKPITNQYNIFLQISLTIKTAYLKFVADNSPNIFLVLFIEYVFTLYVNGQMKFQDLFSMKNKKKIQFDVCCSCDWLFFKDLGKYIYLKYLTFSILGKKFSRQCFEIFFLFFPENSFWHNGIVHVYLCR